MFKTPLLYILLAVGASAVAALPAAGSPAAKIVPASTYALLVPSSFDEARDLLAAGELEKAEETTLKVLSTDPYNTEGYILMFDIAAAQEEPDIEAMLRWGKWLTWSYTASNNSAGLEIISTKMTEMYPEWDADGLTLGSWRTSVEKAAKSASSKKQFRLAGHLMNKLLDLNPQDKKLNKTYDKLADKAGNELTGGAFVSDKVKRKSAKWLAKNNAKHEDWENPWTKKTKSYDIETTMDYEFFETLAAAMEEMNAFYRSIYDFRKKSPRARLVVFRKRSDFDRFTQELTGNPIQSESVGGFWVNSRKTVNAFDRSMGDPNQTRADLWNTLFHEASHQFMSIRMEKSVRRGLYTPAWLGEGAASYFEGSVIKADGTILKNNVAEHRLRNWWGLEHSDRRHSLEDLIAHVRNTGPTAQGLLSYEGEYYPYGWAFVYFLLNYEENDRRVYAPSITPGEGIPAEYKTVRKAGKLVYRQAYLDYIEHFAKEGNKANDQYYPFEVAKRIFVDEIGDPDVPNWEAFEDRWRRFTNSLYGEMLAGPEFADVLHARSRGYILAEDYERARTTAEQADEKRPNDSETYRLLAEANEGEGLSGDAMYWMVRHWESVWQAGDETAADEAEQWIKDHKGSEVLKNYIEPTKIALAGIRLDMEKALGDGHPVLATLYATHAMQAFQLQFPDLIEQAKEMSEIAGQDLRVWQAAFVRGPEANRKATTDSGTLVDVVLYEDDGVLIYDPEGWASPGLETTTVPNLQFLTPPFSIRGTIQLDGDVAAIPFGIDRSGRAQIQFLIAKYDDTDDAAIFNVMSYSVDSRAGEASLRRNQVGGLRWERTKEVDFMIDVLEDGSGKLYINEEEPIDLPKEFSKRKLTGGFGLGTSDGTAALFSDIQVRPSTAFWPVTQAEDEE